MKTHAMLHINYISPVADYLYSGGVFEGVTYIRGLTIVIMQAYSWF